jgi:hypothetical protein
VVNDEIVKSTGALALTVKSRTKAQLDEAVETFLSDALEVHGAAELVVLQRQMNLIVKKIDEKLKEDELAVNSVLKALGGSMRGEILGAEVKVSFPKRWIYDAETQGKIAELKQQIKLLETQAQLAKTAMQMESNAVITVCLKGE